jgi:hypothetical protein
MKILAKLYNNGVAWAMIPDFVLLDLDPARMIMIQNQSVAIEKDYELHTLEFDVPGDIELVNLKEGCEEEINNRLGGNEVIEVTGEIEKYLEISNEFRAECDKISVLVAYGEPKAFGYNGSIKNTPTEIYTADIPFALFEKETQRNR